MTSQTPSSRSLCTRSQVQVPSPQNLPKAARKPQFRRKPQLKAHPQSQTALKLHSRPTQVPRQPTAPNRLLRLRLRPNLVPQQPTAPNPLLNSLYSSLCYLPSLRSQRQSLLSAANVTTPAPAESSAPRTETTTPTAHSTSAKSAKRTPTSQADPPKRAGSAGTTASAWLTPIKHATVALHADRIERVGRVGIVGMGFGLVRTGCVTF